MVAAVIRRIVRVGIYARVSARMLLIEHKSLFT